MRSTRTRLAGLAALAVAIGLLGAAATPALAAREATAIYAGTNDSLRRHVGVASVAEPCALADGRPLAGTGAGAYCFSLRSHESQVRVRIVDSSGLPVGAALYFLDGWRHSGWLGTGAPLVFCERTVVTIPYGTTRLVVQVGGDSVGQATSGPSEPHPALPCGPSGGIPTAGTIVAFFS